MDCAIPVGIWTFFFFQGQKSNLSILEFSMKKYKWPFPWSYLDVQKRKIFQVALGKLSKQGWEERSALCLKGIISRSGFPNKQEKTWIHAQAIAEFKLSA